MCTAPKPEKIKNIIPSPTLAPEKAPIPVEVAPNKIDQKRKGRGSLRIDLAGSGTPASGVVV